MAKAMPNSNGFIARKLMEGSIETIVISNRPAGATDAITFIQKTAHKGMTGDLSVIDHSNPRDPKEYIFTFDARGSLDSVLGPVRGFIKRPGSPLETIGGPQAALNIRLALEKAYDSNEQLRAAVIKLGIAFPKPFTDELPQIPTLAAQQNYTTHGNISTSGPQNRSNHIRD